MLVNAVSHQNFGRVKYQGIQEGQVNPTLLPFYQKEKDYALEKLKALTDSYTLKILQKKPQNRRTIPVLEVHVKNNTTGLLTVKNILPLGSVENFNPEWAMPQELPETSKFKFYA